MTAEAERIRQLEKIICLMESRITLPPELADIQRDIFDRYPYGTLEEDRHP